MNYYTPESQTVKNYVLLINGGKWTMERVPNLSNLREVVQEILNEKTDR